MGIISVVVPVYNVEAYLCRCIDSILCQSFPDFTLVLVDDGSPDSCGAICDAYARQDARIHVIHQKNAGLSAARNAGIDWCLAQTTTQWLTFVDSDDWIHPDYLAGLLQAAQIHETQVSACAYARIEAGMPEVRPEDRKAQLWNADRFYLEKRVIATVACAKLYHKSCFAAVRYPLGRIHEDEYVTYRLLFQCGTVAFVPAPLYAYYVNPQGITGKAWSPRRLDAWDAYEEQLCFFEKQGNWKVHYACFREYLENGYAQYLAAQAAPNARELGRVLRKMKRRMRKVILRAWRRGCIAFWPDFDMLYTFAPFCTKVYRFLLEHWRK